MPCTYEYSVNFTPEAKDFKIQQCMMHISDGGPGLFGSCRQYFSGLAGTTDEMDKCTTTDYANECKKLAEKWTNKGRYEYCERMVQANDDFWENNRPTWIREKVRLE